VLIEINLAPGASGSSAAARRLPPLRLPAIPTLGGDPRLVLAGVLALVLVALAPLSIMRLESRQTDLQARIQQEVADSARYAATIALMQGLRARQDSVIQKIEVIRSVDSRRYEWPRLLDQVSLSVPAYTWLTQMNTGGGRDGSSGPVFALQGFVGTTQALTRLMKNLEGSPFIREVTLITTEQDELDGRTVLRFSLEARYEVAEPSLVRTVPLFGSE
jgi:Tfp pilus assembly protein PilN